VIKIEPTLILNHTETMVVPAPKDLMERTAETALQDFEANNQVHVICNFSRSLSWVRP